MYVVIRIDYANFCIIKSFDKIMDFFFGRDRQMAEKEARFEL